MPGKPVRKRFVKRKRHKPGVPTFSDFSASASSTADSENNDAFDGSSLNDPGESTAPNLPLVSPSPESSDKPLVGPSPECSDDPLVSPEFGVLDPPNCIVLEAQDFNPDSACNKLVSDLSGSDVNHDSTCKEFHSELTGSHNNPDSSCKESHSEVSGCDITKNSTTPRTAGKQNIPEWIPSKDVLLETKFKIEQFLPKFHHVLLHQDTLHVVLVSRSNNLSVQRTIVLYGNGMISLFVHRKELSVKRYLDKELPPALLKCDSVNYFVDRSVKVINNISQMEICSGYDNEDFKAAWSSCPAPGTVDANMFDECRYEETFRSVKCEMLVTNRQWRCRSCKKLYLPLRRRTLALANEQLSAFAHNTKMSEEQKLKKMAELQRDLKNERKKNARLREKMEELIDQQGVQIDADLAGDLTEILKESDLSPAHSIFLQQQVKASQKKNMVGMRWHPTMIRLALAIHITSPAAYELIRDSGMVKLPSSRTLFDYSHVKPVNDGIDKVVLESLGDRVSKLHPKNRYFVAMADEMHIYGNLVMQKSTGRIIGYKKLDEVDKEVEVLNKFLDNPNEKVEEILATKILVYMVKSVSAGIKEVVATFPVSNPSAQQMYVWTWQIIGALERSGVRVIAFTCDGFSTNRAFIKMHKPATKTNPNSFCQIFDTINKAAPHRKLYFISDVPHLLKTIRNCFMNSRWDNKKSRRHMKYKGKKITWDFLVKLYETQKGKSLRKTFKLNAMNVYPDSYGRMKVLYAAQAVSATAAQDIEDRKWPGTSETVHFMRTFNDWFDCLNGPHSFTGKRKRNQNLNPYTKDVLGDDPKDKRFQFLDSVVHYLHSWKEDTMKKNLNESVTSIASLLGADVDESEIFEGSDDEGEDDTPAARRILSRETLEGIEMSTLSIKAAITFLLQEGLDYVNPRIFTQDPLEQHFSKVRAGQGGSNNPNYYQALNRNRALHTIGQLGVRKRKGNCSEGGSSIEVTTERLPKRKCQRGPKFDM